LHDCFHRIIGQSRSEAMDAAIVTTDQRFKASAFVCFRRLWSLFDFCCCSRARGASPRPLGAFNCHLVIRSGSLFVSVLSEGGAPYCRFGWGVFSFVGGLSLCHLVLGSNETESQLASIFEMHASRHRCESLEQGSVLIRNWNVQSSCQVSRTELRKNERRST